MRKTKKKRNANIGESVLRKPSDKKKRGGGGENLTITIIASVKKKEGEKKGYLCFRQSEIMKKREGGTSASPSVIRKEGERERKRDP